MRGTGKPVGAERAITRASRSTAWAPGSSGPGGLRRRTKARPRRVEAVGRVGLAALELADGQRAGEPGDIGRHPRLERGDVEAQRAR